MAIEVFPVVHLQDERQAVEQARRAFEAGADGVYLIDHEYVGAETLLHAFNDVVAENPARFVGLNFLNHASAAQSLQFLQNRVNTGSLAKLPDGLWADDADQDKDRAVQLRNEHTELAGIQYLGGVAFKGTRFFTDDPNEAVVEAERLSRYVDVVTTSGAYTGKSANPEKIKAMKAAIGDQPLAIASGVGLENIHNYAGMFDQLLVATSVEVVPMSGIFDPRKLKDLIDVAHEL